MKAAFQIVKAFAIVLAVMIIVSIVGAVVAGVESLGMINRGSDDDYKVVLDAGYTNVHELDINVKATDLRIVEAKEGEPVRVETSSKYIDQWQDGDTLHVVERSHGVFGWNAASVTTIYLKKDLLFERIRLEIGAGSFTATTNLNAKKAIIDLGAGRAELAGLFVTDQAKVETGAGLLEIHDGKVKDLNLDMGVGKVSANLRLVGDNKIKSGTGKLELGLIGSKADYALSIDKGIGSVTLDGADLHDGERTGSGMNHVEIESGVGAVEINLNSEKNNDR